MNCKQKKLVFYVFLYNYLNYIWKNGIINSGYKNTNKKHIKVRRMNMKKSNLIKVVLVLGISLMVMLFTTNVMAANEVDLTNTIENPSSSSNSNLDFICRCIRRQVPACREKFRSWRARDSPLHSRVRKPLCGEGRRDVMKRYA